MLDLHPIEERLEKATKGPWEYDSFYNCISAKDGEAVVEATNGVDVEFNADLNLKLTDADLIAHAPTDLSALIAEVKALRMERDADTQPLTMDELRQMDGEPVWAVDGSGSKTWVLIDVDDFKRPNGIDKDTGFWDGDFYGMTCGCKIMQRECKCTLGLHKLGWLAYRHKPNSAE